MNIRVLLSAALLTTASSVSAMAAATAEEAARIQAAMETYLGKEPGVISVTPEGDAYTIKLDATPYFAKVKEPGFKAYADPYVFKATPAGNGQWSVAGTGTWGFQMNADNKFQMTLRVGEQNWSGTYDEALAAFTQSTATYGNISLTQSMPDPSGNTTSIAYNIGSGTSETTATAADAGTVDSTSVMTFNTITTANSMTGPDGQAAPDLAMFNYSMASPKLSYTTSAKGISYRPVMDLLAFFVARPDKQLIIDDQAMLKDKLKAALPFFKSMAGNATYEGLMVTTAMGQFEMATAGGDINMNGLVKDGFVQEKIGFTGFKMPAGIAPPWAADLVPSTFKVDFSVRGFDLDAPTQIVLTQLDLTLPELLPTGVEDQLMPAFMPTNAITVDLGASEISNALYSLTYDGQITGGVAGLPTGKANIRMKGMDAVIGILQANGADPTAQQALAGLIGMKGMGKAEADGTTLWVIDALAPGKILVNGLDVSAMLGMATPQ